MKSTKWLGSVCCVAVLFLAGCETLSQHDRTVLQAHRVSEGVYDKMLHREPLDVPDIIELSRRDVPTPFILRYMRSKSVVYYLSSTDVTRLRKAGVDQAIVDYMLATPRMDWARYGPYPYPYGPYYPYDPYYYGPYVGVQPFYGRWHYWR